jgi:ADP-ribosyl-[dinitrogen reductase] hydrolase
MTKTISLHPPVNINHDLYLGCLLGGAVGDALGAPVEFMSSAEITQQFGPSGIQDYVPVFGITGAITDDTQMTLFTAEGVIRAWVRAFVHAPSAIPSSIASAYQRWLHTQGLTHPMHNDCVNGWLITQKCLFARRAPGGTCLSGLQSMQTTEDVAKNESKGCGGVMRVAPIGMYFATLAVHGGVQTTELIEEAFATGCRSAAITHGHPTGKLASGALAAIVMQLLTNTSLEQTVERVLSILETHPDHEETKQAIERAYSLAKQRPNDKNALTQLGGGWVAEEALAIALYCALSAADFRSGVVMAVNHGGDSDSTGSIAGQLLGAMYGATAIPTSWRTPLELGAVIEAMAYDLATFADWKTNGVDVPSDHSARYQEHPIEVDETPGADIEEDFDLLDGFESPEVSDEDQERFVATRHAVAAWEESYRVAAQSDDFQVLRAHLQKLELPDEPRLLLEGTVLVVQMTAAYLAMDGQQVSDFLAQQIYNPTRLSMVPYMVTFDIHGKAYARVNVHAPLRPLDFEDLYGTPWKAYERVGYSDFWISRIDGNALNAQEISDLSNAVESDLQYGFDPDEVTFWFDPDTHDGILKVTVQDVLVDDDDL